MKRKFLPLFVLGLAALSLVGAPDVSAASYTSTLNLPADTSHVGSYRWYDSKNFLVDINIDNLTGCTGSREKKLWITLHYSSTNQVSGKMANTALYSCVTANMGNFKNGNYAYGFSTKYSDGRQFCGVVSNYVRMYQS